MLTGCLVWGVLATGCAQANIPAPAPHPPAAVDGAPTGYSMQACGPSGYLVVDPVAGRLWYDDPTDASGGLSGTVGGQVIGLAGASAKPVTAVAVVKTGDARLTVDVQVLDFGGSATATTTIQSDPMRPNDVVIVGISAEGDLVDVIHLDDAGRPVVNSYDRSGRLRWSVSPKVEGRVNRVSFSSDLGSVLILTDTAKAGQPRVVLLGPSGSASARTCPRQVAMAELTSDGSHVLLVRTAESGESTVTLEPTGDLMAPPAWSAHLQQPVSNALVRGDRVLLSTWYNESNAGQQAAPAPRLASSFTLLGPNGQVMWSLVPDPGPHRWQADTGVDGDRVVVWQEGVDDTARVETVGSAVGTSTVSVQGVSFAFSNDSRSLGVLTSAGEIRSEPLAR